LGVQLAGVALRKGASRFVPLLGALGVGAYAYYDTQQVANNALALFGGKPNDPDNLVDTLDTLDTIDAVDPDPPPQLRKK
jgi:hypothetical protein